MKKLLCILLFAVTAKVQAAGLITSHVDIRFDYAPTGWSCFLQYGESFNEPDIQADPETVSLPARDFLTTAGGDRLTQPSNPTFAFTGAQVGAPLWNLPQSNRGYTWPGFDNRQNPSVFLSYLNSDPRVNNTINAKWWRVQLLDVDYSGEATITPRFSLWQTGSGGAPTVWMATSDGITTQDAYFTTEGSHSHMNWGFTQLGIYRITFRASAFLAANSSLVESDAHAITFAIGTLATWRASHFAGLDLLDANVGVPMADPDGDGQKNIIEYAFNMNPNMASLATMIAGTGISGLPLVKMENVGGQDRLTIEFVRRKSNTNPQITYHPEFSSTLQTGDWQSAGTSSVTSLDTTWERVKITDSVAANGRRFGRVRILIQPTISY